ncbi:hypothetical protein PCE1_001984 [Barthelona sp. PCE]
MNRIRGRRRQRHNTAPSHAINIPVQQKLSPKSRKPKRRASHAAKSSYSHRSNTNRGHTERLSENDLSLPGYQPKLEEEETPRQPGIPEEQEEPYNADNWKSYRVVARIRPLLSHETKKRERSCISVKPTSIAVECHDGSTRSYTFHSCFGPEATQQDIYYDSGVRRVLTQLLRGYNGCVFAYGMTGSGKTHTMAGQEGLYDASRNMLEENEMEGLIPRLSRDLFVELNRMLRDPSGQLKKVAISVQALEVYNEQCMDLLNVDPDVRLRIRQTDQHTFIAENAITFQCNHARELMEAIDIAISNRRTACHELNTDSSRSHMIFTINLTLQHDDQPKMTSKLVLCDLAGSERLKTTKSKGVTQTETLNINKSLHILGRVISFLSSKSKDLPPVRDSVLTKLLSDSLIGRDSLVLMLACLSPASSFVEESLSTLRYAAKAQKITTELQKNFLDPKDKIIARLKKQLKSFKTELNHLKSNHTARERRTPSHSTQETDVFSPQKGRTPKTRTPNSRTPNSHKKNSGSIVRSGNSSRSGNGSGSVSKSGSSNGKRRPTVRSSRKFHLDDQEDDFFDDEEYEEYESAAYGSNSVQRHKPRKNHGTHSSLVFDQPERHHRQYRDRNAPNSASSLDKVRENRRFSSVGSSPGQRRMSQLPDPISYEEEVSMITNRRRKEMLMQQAVDAMTQRSKPDTPTDGTEAQVHHLQRVNAQLQRKLKTLSSRAKGRVAAKNSHLKRSLEDLAEEEPGIPGGFDSPNLGTPMLSPSISMLDTMDYANSQPNSTRAEPRTQRRGRRASSYESRAIKYARKIGL